MEKLNYDHTVIVTFEFLIIILVWAGFYIVLDVLESVGKQLAQIISELREEEIDDE